MENTTLYYHYAPDNKVWDGAQRRLIAEHTQALPNDYSLILTAERYSVERSIGESYNAYRIGAAHNWFDTDFTLSYWHNTIHDNDSTTKDHVVLEVSKKFDLF